MAVGFRNVLRVLAFIGIIVVIGSGVIINIADDIPNLPRPFNWTEEGIQSFWWPILIGGVALTIASIVFWAIWRPEDS